MNSELNNLEEGKSWIELSHVFSTAAGFIIVIASIYYGIFGNLINHPELNDSINNSIIYLNNLNQSPASIILVGGESFLYLGFSLFAFSISLWCWGHSLISKKKTYKFYSIVFTLFGFYILVNKILVQ